MFNINDIVKINGTNTSGKITRIKKSSTSTLYTVNINNSNIIVEENQIKLNNKKEKENCDNNNKVTITYNLDTEDFTNEIMLRHQTVEVALENLDKFISQAICNKEKRVKIIHGRHGGILRNAVHDYLKNSPYIESFKLGDYYEGSIGVTIAYLK